jgi:outer membrane protein OmpA-like peptidoglycan-associated protein
MRLLLAVAIASLPLLAATAQAQPRDFKCIGAERLEDDVFEVPFPARSARPAAAARTPVAAAAALAKAEPDRNICVLGFAGREGGQSSATQLAARRAREVAEMLSVTHGIPRDRIRAEARNPGFSRSTENREARSVTIVVLPDLGTTRATPPATERVAPPAPAAPPAPPRAAPPATVPAEPPAATPPAAPAP